MNMREERRIPTHPKNGWNILVAMENPLSKMYAAIVGSQAKARIHWSATMKEAAEFLQSVDSTLPDVWQFINDGETTHT